MLITTDFLRIHVVVFLTATKPSFKEELQHNSIIIIIIIIDHGSNASHHTDVWI